MARVAMTGFGINDPFSVANPDSFGSTLGGTATRTTVGARSVYCVKCDSGAGNGAVSVFPPQMGLGSFGWYNTNSITYFTRVYFKFDNFPGSTVSILAWAGFTGVGAQVKITSGGALQMWGGGAQIGSNSSALSLGTWYRVELKTVLNSTSQMTDIELRLDGATVAVTSGQTITISSGQYAAGWNEAPGANNVCYIADIAVNDSSGAANNSWCGDGRVVLMLPISDNNRGAWVAGAAGTTNLFDGVNNMPPVGVADASATNTSQIKNKSATNPSSCDFNLDTYTNAGVSGTVNAIYVFGSDGEDPATGTKTGAFSMVSNPAISEPTAFSFGNDAGAQGTYPGLWVWHPGVMSNAPSVTLGTAPVIRARCISGATTGRAASVDFLGAYVDYTPAVVPPPVQPKFVGQAVQRAVAR